VAQNYTEAARLYRLAAEQGHAVAQNNLGWFYANGFGVTQDFDEASHWFKKSAAQGNSRARVNLGWLADKVFDVEYQTAKKYQKGDGVPKDAVEAFNWMQKAAQSDLESTKVNDALYELGLMYEKGDGVKADLTEAHNYIFRAATGGQPDASFRMGEMYENGAGVPRDDYQATRYYYNAVANLNGRKFKSKAAENLLKLYAEGRGLSKTNTEPEDYLDRALADKQMVIQQFQGEITTAQAEVYIGRIYNEGALISQDFAEAAARFQLAANEGLDDAKTVLVQLETKMSPDQKEAARNRSINLKKSLDQKRLIEQATIQAYGW
jgi:TPR repeat protein